MVANMVQFKLLAVLVMMVAMAVQLGTVTGYSDGEGSYVTSDGVHRGIGYKCWNDYFVVHQGRKAGPWRKASGNVWCTGTSQCQVQKLTGIETCETWSIEISTGVQGSIISFGATAGYAMQKCKKVEDQTQCTWDDKKCHTVWAQQEIAWQSGYKRKRCNRGHGDKTEEITDWGHEAPTGFVSYGCGSKCSD